MNRKREKLYSETTAGFISADHIAWVVLILVMIFTGLVRYRLRDIPLDRDEGEYAYVGQLILDGVPPYQEVYNMKLPGIYAAYAVILAVFGQTHQGIHTGLLVINEITIVLVFLLAKRLLNASAAVISAAAFAIFSVGVSVHGLSANAEHFVVLFAVAGLLGMLWALDKNSLWGLFAAGVLLGISFTIKQHGFVFGVFVVFYLVLDSVFQKPILWRKLTVKGLCLAAGITAVMICLCLVIIWTGVFENFWFWTVDYARMYVSQIPLQDGWEMFVVATWCILTSSPLLWAVSGIGLVGLMTRWTTSSQKRFLWMYAVFSFLSVCPGLYFRPHYFILLLPCAALLAGTAIYILSSWLSRRTTPYRYIPLLLTAICTGQAIYLQRGFLFQLTPFEVCFNTYGSNPFPESLEIASYIRNHTTPKDTIAILGSEPQICFYAHRRSASGHIYMYPLMEEHPFALQMQKDFIRETEAKKPKYVVFVHLQFSWLQGKNSHKLIYEWTDHYLKQFRLVGTVELKEDTTVYRWDSRVQWPVPSKEWIAVFERREDQN